MNALALLMLVTGTVLACYGSAQIDRIDDLSGRRPGAAFDGYGSNIGFHWPYTMFCQVGLAMALLSICVFVAS